MALSTGQNLPGTFRSFDLALPDTHAPQRFTTTVPQQALFLMNSPFVIEQAKALPRDPTNGSGEAESRPCIGLRTRESRRPKEARATASS